MANNRKPKIGQTIYWYFDTDPGDPEVGPQPNIIVVEAKVLEIERQVNGDMYTTIDSDGIKHGVRSSWLASEDDIQEYLKFKQQLEQEGQSV